jgi:glycosyltransferase involved in cell wall biosynthesis
MAWNRRVERKVGKPPAWAECLPPGVETPREFFGKLHCMVQANGGAGENWPRSGLEAMACGVPVVVQNQWGWREMIRHAETGYLCENAEDMAAFATRLAKDERVRLAVAENARASLETELAPAETIWTQWREIFASLVASRSN